MPPFGSDDRYQIAVAIGIAVWFAFIVWIIAT